MCTPDKCIDKLADLLFDKAIKACKYVRDYNDNLQQLQVKSRDLGDCMEIITRKVSVADAYGEVIEVNVLHWQKDANTLKDDIQQLFSIKASIPCIACSCPNISRRHKFSKRAEEKMPNVDDLITKYNNFKDHISHPGTHYTENLKKLQEKLEDLGDCTKIIKRKVLAAKGRGDEIEVDVLRWQIDAANLKDGIDQLIRENTTKASDIEQLIRESTTEARICSTECPCPDVMWQYKFGKQAVEKIADADGLIMKYNNFKDQISHTGSHYMDNLQKLQVRLRDLGDCMDKIKGKVSEANDRGHEIEVNVSHWQTEADSLKDGIEQLIRGSTAKASICSTECPFPDIMWQYEFSKHAEDKIADADELIIKYNNFKDSISHPKARPPEFLSDTNYVNFDSRVSILKNIKDALRIPDVNMIGVFGPGGVGKTTLVKEVGEQMRKDGIFNQVAIATVSANLDVKEVQTRLAASLNFKFEASMDDQVGRATELSKKFLNGDNYLVILDDIWEEVKMEAIGIPCRNGKKGCKVVLTSRNENLLSTVMEVDRNFPMETLSSAEAWTLFAKTLFTMNAGNSNQSQQKMNSLAYKVCDPPKENSLEYEVCERCQGLPVAIVALGKALKGKQEHAWTTALKKMKKYMLTEVEDIDRSGLAGLASLKVSYKMLRTADAKSCFLLCCFFAEDAEIQLDELTRICMARSLLAQNPGTLEEARNVVRTVLDVLKSASLLSNGSNEDAVRIHDVIRDAGIKIARDQGESFLIDHGVFQWPRDPPNGPSYSAISLIFKNINELPDGLKYPELHTLMIENSERSDVQFPNDFFAGMTQLTVLTITRMRMQQLPSSLAKLTKLRMLYLHECELADISMLKDLKKNLEVLSLQYSYIQALPVEIGELTNLRVFDLRRCQNLKVIPRGAISKLKNLEELYFALNFDKWEGTIAEQGDTSSRDNVSLEELKGLLKDGQLTTLFIHIPAVMLLPKEDLIFANLKRFAISVGSPFDSWKYRKILDGGKRVLKLEEIQLRNDVITLAEKADRLFFRGIKGLNRVLRNGTVGNKFLDLEYLEIVSCDCDREYFLGEPKSFEQSRGLHDLQPFNKLTRLTIEKRESKYLFSPTATRGLVHLKTLQVRSCKIMEGIVGCEGQNDANEIIGEVKFGKLKKLRLKSLPNLISFYVKKEKMGTTMGSSSARAQPLFNEKVIFHVLEKLTIEDLGNIINIWDKQSIGVLEKQGSFGQLIDLYVKDCKKLMHVFPSSTHPLIKNLNNLGVFDCETMEGIIEVASPALEHLADIQGQEVINKDIIVFPQLKSMDLYRLPKLKSFYNETQGFFSHKVAFPILEELDFDGLSKITRIWDNQPLSEQEKQAKSFCELITLRVDWCVNLEYVLPFYMLPQLKNLQKLYITGCLMMEVILSNNRKDLALLPNIRSLSTYTQLSFSDKVASSTLKQLAEIQEIDVINNDIIVFPQLKSVELKELPELKSFYVETEGFFSHKVAFPVLEELILSNLCNITRIWDGQALSESEKEAKSFCKLTNFNVHNCVNLEYALPLYMLPLLKNLQELNISRCLKMEVIISNNPTEKEAIKDDTIRCPELKTLQLYDLPNLKSLSTGYTQLCFSNKDAFPVLDKIFVENFGTKKEISIEDESSEKIDLQIIEFFRSGKEFQSVEGDSKAGSVFHYVCCHGCGVCPIIGPRFGSTVKFDYDLCSVCFSIMGVATDYVRWDHPFDSFKRLSDPELDDDLEIPNEISMKQSTKVWELFLKIFHYGKQSKEEYGTSGKVSDTSDEELDQDLKIFMDNISMKRANALWKIYFMIFRNGKQSKEECGTSGKEIDPNGEELNEDLEISTNKISMEDALTVLQKIFFENIQIMMESKGECGTSSKGNGKESNHNGEELDEDLETLTNKISMEDAITVPGKIFENIRNGEESKEECGTGSKENDHNSEELNEDLETPTNEISMEDALTVLGKIFENIYRKESKEKCGTSGEESDQSCEES